SVPFFAQLSARLSRTLRLLRDHGLIRKIPCQRKYALTAQGQTLTTALNAMLAASTQHLMEKAA
ncbi:MAG: winged helix-turn-helix transcriptional regulator, partial [Verrucomicrobia bacterium]|nr:winged helix-turn-helix transcriptional regulator [Verrucomicrobiota bacterium]